MAITDHVAILLGHSFDVARLNKKKTRADFYAQFAFPPAAVNDLAALVTEIYPGVPLASLEVNLQTNAQQSKPFVGVPADWYILRAASQFAPELYEADGVTIVPNAAARQAFFAGMRVRLHTSAWGWKNEFGKSGASFNLLGVMDAGVGGDRLAIGGGGQSAAAFASHANPNAQSSVAAVTGATNTGNPFGGQQQAQQTAAPAASANPFAQQTQAAANPFAAA